MKIVLTDWAEQDLLDGRCFYEAQQAGVGEYFVDCLISDIDSLAYFAGIHRKVGKYHKSLSRVFPYAIYYTTNNKEARIWAVLDCRRDPAWIRQQLSRRT